VGLPKSDRVNPDPVLAGTTTFTDIGAIIAHEIGHAIGLDGPVSNPLCTAQSQTIMEGLKSDWTAKMTAVQPTDVALANQHMNSEGTCTQKATQSVGDSKDPGPAPSPTPTPAPTCSGNPTFTCASDAWVECNEYGIWVCSDGSNGCSIPPPGWITTCDFGAQCTFSGWQCIPGSPIIIDTKGEGFHLTDVAHGVKFALMPGQPPLPMAWTDPAFSNGFLVLDRNGDGMIDDGSELFGNLTPQPPSATPNGFLALAVFDQPENGGNGNGYIDPGDAIYGKLRVWIDANHNGISEPGELHTLKELGIVRIDLNYRLSRYTDQFGNRFRYVAKIWDEAGRAHDLCYDVFLRTGGSDTTQ
jgi:hypothetical protein